MSKLARKKLFVDESRIWNLEESPAGVASNMKTSIRSILFRYMWYDVHVESLLNIKGSSRILAAMGITEKKKKTFLEKDEREDSFYSLPKKGWTVLYPALTTKLIFFGNKVGGVFVTKFFHDKRARNFLKYLEYVEEYGPDNVRYEYPEIGRKYYEYKRAGIGLDVKSLLVTYSDWPFPETYYKPTQQQDVVATS